VGFSPPAVGNERGPTANEKILVGSACKNIRKGAHFEKGVCGSEKEKAAVDALAKTHWMAKQKFRPTRLGGFSGAKAYIR